MVEPEDHNHTMALAGREGLSPAEPSILAHSVVSIEPGERAELQKLTEMGENPDIAELSQPDELVDPKKRKDIANVAEPVKHIGPEGRGQTIFQERSKKMSSPAQIRVENGLSTVVRSDVAVRPTTDSSGRPFRRVLSANDALEDDEATLVPRPMVPQARDPLRVLENLSRRNTPRTKSPSKVIRCASDTLALDIEAGHVAKSAELISKGPTGPWTVDEAFLLFDFWPAEMEKPEYWVDKAPRTVSCAVPAAFPSNWGGITTARQFLRDDVNVL